MSHELTVEELTAELRAMREAPTEEFAASLDARAASGFSGRHDGVLGGLARGETVRSLVRRARETSPRRKLTPAMAGAATVLVAATAVVIASDRNGGGEATKPTPVGVVSGAVKAAPAGGAAARPKPNTEIPIPSEGALSDSAIAPEPLRGPGTAPGVRDRRVQRSAELTLGTDPAQVQAVSGKVYEVVGRYRGIVLSSSIRDGAEGDAGAGFELLVPGRRLSPALADLSSLAEVRSRSEDTLDITAPFVSAREHLRDARAEAEGLLRQLGEADTDAERASVKAQLQIVRGRIAAFRGQVTRLERRANFSHVSLQITTAEGAAIPGAGSEDWTPGDALHDAGRVLSVAAGVALIGLALTLPVALLGGAAWAGRRAYLRRARAQALAP